MVVTNKANMDAMMERMNALMASRGGNKENAPLNSGANKAAKTGGLSKRARKPTHVCPTVVYLAVDCYKLEANKDKRYTRWVSCLPVTATA